MILKNKKRKVQSILEYSVLIAVVATGLAAMTIYVKRAVQANLNQIEEQVDVQPVQPSE